VFAAQLSMAHRDARVVSSARAGATCGFCSVKVPDLACGVRAGPSPLAPPHPHRPAEAGRVHELDDSPAVAAGDETAAGAPLQARR